MLTDPVPSAALSPAGDFDLIRQMAAGSEEALAELIDRYSTVLTGFAGHILGNPADAEEVALEVFVHAWTRADRYDPARSSVSTWLVLIARSRAIDRLRSRRVAERTREAVRQQGPAAHESPRAARNVWIEERRKRVVAAMRELPAEQREVLALAYYGGWTQSEIAAETGIPLGTVKTRTLLAMRKLRAALSDDLNELL
jgi:RNA polymerase sigma-70 factor, ECF subfamily